MLTRLRAFLKDGRGAVTVEMALVTPILAACVVAGYQVWDAANRKNDMRLALQPATRYYMNGGGDDDVAKALAMSAWHATPATATLTAVRTCRCAQTETSCAVLCAGNKNPSQFVTLTAHATWSNVSVGSDYTETAVVRVQ